MVSLPPSLQVTLTWGSSTLWTKQVELPCDVDIAEIGGRLLGDRSACELRTATAVHVVRPERRLRTEHGELELVVDAVTDDIAPAMPSSIDPRRAAFDLGSMVLHAGVGLMLFMLADPLAADLVELPSQEMLPTIADTSIVFGDAMSPTRTADDQPGGHRAIDKRDPGAAGPGSSTHAAQGEPWRPTAGGPAVASKERATFGIEDVRTMPMIALIARAQHGAEELSSGEDAWSGAGLESGASWGDAGGIGAGSGIGGLTLSGIGEGGGGLGQGIGLGRIGTGSCGATCTGSTAGRLGGSHRVRTSMTLCGTRYVDGVKVADHDCSAHVSGRLPAEAIQRIVRQNFGRFRFCYEKDLRMQPSLSERVTVSFTIGRDGSVSRASGTADGGALQSTASCVARAFSGLSFPEPEGGVVNVTYPLVFSPD